MATGLTSCFPYTSLPGGDTAPYLPDNNWLQNLPLRWGCEAPAPLCGLDAF